MNIQEMKEVNDTIIRITMFKVSAEQKRDTFLEIMMMISFTDFSEPMFGKSKFESNSFVISIFT